SLFNSAEHPLLSLSFFSLKSYLLLFFFSKTHFSSSLPKRNTNLHTKQNRRPYFSTPPFSHTRRRYKEDWDGGMPPAAWRRSNDTRRHAKRGGGGEGERLGGDPTRRCGGGDAAGVAAAATQ
ncbi:hypothetical protein LINPERHAP2_LOCUS28866, partial [Linum perenne]